MTAAIFKIPDSAVSDNYGKKSQTWNKFSKISNLPTLNDEIRKEKSGKNWKGNSTSNSLYITAHENSSEAVTFDSFHDNENSLKNMKFSSIKRHKILDTSTFFIQNPFEFSRQQNYEVPEPEMCQYKASQRLLNPNEASMIVQQAGTVTEIWMFLQLLIFVVSTGVIISITCNKSRQPPQRKKYSNAESMKSKKNKDEKKFDENNTYNNVEKSLKTDPRNDKQQQNVETPLILRTPAPTPFVETPIIPTDEEEEEDFCYDSTSPEVSRSNSKNTPDNRSSKSSDKISLVSVPSTATTSNEENVKIQPKNQISRQQAFINFCRYLLFLSEGKKQLQKLFIKIWNVYAQLAKEKTEKWKDDETQKAQLERLMLTKQCDQKYRENVKKNKTEEWDITTLFNAIRSVNSFVKKPYQLKEFNEVDNLNSIRNQTFHGRFGYTPAEFETKKNELVDCLRKLGMTMEVIEIIKHHSQNIIYVGEASEQKSTPKKSVTQEITTKSKSFNKPQFDSTAEMFGKRTEVNALGGSLCGLANPGSLCYMNVILQSLFALTAFRRIILKANVQNVVVKALQKLFIKMQFGQIQCDSYDIFVSSKWSEEKDSAGQQDIEEFLTSFIKEIEEALIPVGLDNELQNLLRGYTCNYTESTPTIHVLRLNLFSSDQSIIKNIYPALKQYYETQRHDGVELVDAPPILCMYLLRTNYYNDRGTVKTVKINDNIDFPKVLDMNEYMAQPEDDNVDNTKNKIDDYTYVLQSIVTHAGTASTGHYTVFINYKPTVSDLWYLFDDSNVHVFNEKCLFKGDTFLQQGSFTPCMFFYVKKSSIREVTSPSPRICNIAPSLKKELQQQQFNIKIKFYQYTGGKTFPQNAPAKTHETELTLLEILERKQEWLYERAAVYFGVEIDQFNLKAIVDNETALPSFDVVCRSRPIAELCSGKVIHIIVQCP